MSSGNPVEARRFSIAVQALVVMAGADGTCSSMTIASGVEAHAAYLRRVLAQLVHAGIVEAYEGRTGGYRLARPARRITLADVFRAVKLAGPADECSAYIGVPQRVQAALDDIGAEAEQRVLSVLQAHTLASVIERAAGPDAPIQAEDGVARAVAVVQQLSD